MRFSSRTPIVVMNWAMRQNTNDEAINFAKELVISLNHSQKVEKVILPSMGTITSVSEVTKGSNIDIGAQNIAPIEKGEMSGEYSIESLIDIGGKFVEIGHWERRKLFGESDELINQKLLLALSSQITPILCVGEIEKNDNLSMCLNQIERQLFNALFEVRKQDLQNIVIAYTPYWAVGKSYASNYIHIHEIIMGIRDILAKYFDKESGEAIRIIYGGSVSPENTRLIINNPEIDGVLVGRFGSNPKRYVEIVRIVESDMGLGEDK